MPLKDTGSREGPSRGQFVPETFTVDYGHDYPRVPVTHPFLYAYNPQRWTFLHGKVVPHLHMIPLQDGVNHVKAAGGRWKLAGLRSKLETQGRTLVPWEWGPDGSYVAVVKTRVPHSGAIVDSYVPVWSDTYAGSSKLGDGSEAYAEWLQSLMDDGKLPKPELHIVEELLAERQGALVGAMNAQLRSHTESRAQAIAQMQSEIEALEALLNKAPRRKSRKRKPATLEADA